MEILTDEILCLVTTIKKTWKSVFCSLLMEDFFLEQWMSVQDILDYCVEQQEKYKTSFAFINHPELSEWMCKYELTRSKKIWQPMILAIREDLVWLKEFKEFEDYASRIIVFSSLDELTKKLSLELKSDR